VPTTTLKPQRKVFGPDDLELLEELFESATAVVPMAQIAAGATDSRIIGLRHDVDHDLEAALTFAAWENERGYRATYFFLPTADYWHGGPDGELSIFERPGWPKPSAELAEAVKVISALGHEIGFHNNALAEALVSGRPAAEILRLELDALRALGVKVIGDAAHGDPACWDRPHDRQNRTCLFANYELFAECPAPHRGDPDRLISTPLGELRLDPQPMADFGLEYESFYLKRSVLISDSAGEPKVAEYAGDTRFDWDELELPEEGQLHVLLHPEWWAI